MNTFEYLNILNDPEENRKTIRKLPSYLVTRWSRIVDEWVTADELEDDEVPLEERSDEDWLSSLRRILQIR